ncbi:hypothetical protein OIU79_027689 [Salix purpurea]|uniref:Uncharacterized protein n=1 Tax=Salix purpurea TaxID=77065 RepID=A0A9Q1A235_SALPP|nr:hypothetical protein OIU79_027689 [Salix purpurea]
MKLSLLPLLRDQYVTSSSQDIHGTSPSVFALIFPCPHPAVSSDLSAPSQRVHLMIYDQKQLNSRLNIPFPETTKPSSVAQVYYIRSAIYDSINRTGVSSK